MNRIKELIQQSTGYMIRVYETDGVRTLGEREEYFNKEKFAKLLIQDCIEIIEPCKCGCTNGEPESLICETIIKQIKKHFGVE